MNSWLTVSRILAAAAAILLGTAAPPTLRAWFSRLGEGGQVVDDLQTRPWGASDGQVIDRFGLHWLIGFEGDESD